METHLHQGKINIKTSDWRTIPVINLCAHSLHRGTIDLDLKERADPGTRDLIHKINWLLGQFGFLVGLRFKKQSIRIFEKSSRSVVKIKKTHGRYRQVGLSHS